MEKDNRKIKIAFTGGGTGGSVAPLLAFLDFVRENGKDADFFWVGGSGVECEMVMAEKIDFVSIDSGKLRRYFSWQNFSDIWHIANGFFQSLRILRARKPDIVLSAGSFISVPFVWAAWILRIPVLIHQMDVRPGLANKLMAPFAKQITVTFEKSLSDYGNKAVLVGNPIRNKLSDFSMPYREAFQKLGLTSNLPIVLVMGGGTGAAGVNNLIWEALPDLKKFCQIVHITGRGKTIENIHELMDDKYHAFEFLDVNGMLKVFTVSDIVISRCGIATLTELSKLRKASILIPMPDSHQEDNAQVFEEKKAAVVLDEKKLRAEDLVATLRELIGNKEKIKELQDNISGVIKTDAAREMWSLLKKF